MNARVLLSWLGCCYCFVVTAQGVLETHNDFLVQELVLDIFANSACENIDLITSRGDTRGIGYFENGMSSIGIEQGIILSTGYTEFSHGPNNATDQSANLPGPNGDVDLARLSDGQIFDAVVLEFDFVPLDSLVEFRYVFASEEYCEFVGSDFNDVFGFFVSGPGYAGPFSNGAVNVALVPNSDDYVAINTINHAENAAYYVHNELPDDLDRCALTEVYPEHLAAIEYDGFTQVLTAKLRVQVCETYHMRMVIGDVGDPNYDSAVFLEAGSFQLGGEITVESIGQTAGPNQLYAGCEDAVFRFHRSPGSSEEVPLRIDFTVAEASEVVPGEAIEPLPEQAIIPAGASYVDIPIRSFPNPDLQEEELLRVLLDIPCACYTDSADLWLLPAPELMLELPDAYACPGEVGTLLPEHNGGVGPYTYQWSSGSTTSSTTAAPGGPAMTVTVTDLCGQEQSASAEVYPSVPPTAALMGEAEICWGDTAWFPLTATAIPPLTLTFQIDGNAPQSLTLSELTDFPATQPGQYTLLSVRDAACEGPASGEAYLDVWEIMATAQVQAASCIDVADGSIRIDILQAEAPYTITWADDWEGATRTGLIPGDYTAFISDATGCVRPYTWSVGHPPPLVGPSIACEDLFNGQADLVATGGTPPYQYRLNGGPAQSNWPAGMIPSNSYEVTLVDFLGCEVVVDWVAPAFYPDGMVTLPEEVGFPLGLESEMEVQWNMPLDLIADITWESPLGQFSCTDCPYPIVRTLEPEDLSLTVTDIFGCSQTLETELKVLDQLLVFLPNAFSPNGDQVNDIWQIFGDERQVERLEELTVFDRWGSPVFHAMDWPLNSERHGWDGTFRGLPLDDGVFAYWARFRLVNGQRVVRGGDVMLLR